MSDNDRSLQNSDKQSHFDKFIALLTALGGGAGIVTLLVFFLGGGGGDNLSSSSPRTLPSAGNQPLGTSGRSASAFCSSQFANPRDYQGCLQAAQNCDLSSVTYEVCILGEMGRGIIQNP